MKLSLLCLALSLASSALSRAAVVLPADIFTFAASGNRVALTLASDISIPLTTTASDNYIVFVLEDVYATQQGFTSNPPLTTYDTPSAIHAVLSLAGSGASVDAVAYANWGAFAVTLGEVDPDDFYAVFQLPQTAAAGDVLTLKAGTTLMDLLVQMPVLTPKSVTLTTGSGFILSDPVAIIPEPSAAAAGLLASVALLARRRRAR